MANEEGLDSRQPGAVGFIGLGSAYLGMQDAV